MFGDCLREARSTSVCLFLISTSLEAASPAARRAAKIRVTGRVLSASGWCLLMFRSLFAFVADFSAMLDK